MFQPSSLRSRVNQSEPHDSLESPHLKARPQRKLYIMKEVAQSPELLRASASENIFKLVPGIAEFMIDKGPRYHPNGDLIKYTLLGRPEQFLKMGKKQTNFIEDPLTSTKLPRRQSVSHKQSFDTRSMSRKTSTYEKKTKVKQVMRTKHQILDELFQIQSRIEDNRRKEQQEVGYEPVR
jgi:hypothetical protein